MPVLPVFVRFSRFSWSPPASAPGMISDYSSFSRSRPPAPINAISGKLRRWCPGSSVLHAFRLGLLFTGF